MKKFCTALTLLATTVLLTSQGFAQRLLDTANFTISAEIKPSDYPEWSDSTAAWRVYATYDLDKDGKKEFLVIVDPATTSALDTSMATILRFEATANNTYQLVWHAQIPYMQITKGSWPCIAVGDVDKDGNMEIFYGQPSNQITAGDPNPDRIFIYEYEPSSGNFPATPTMTSKLQFPDRYYYAITSIVLDDVDNDGDVEMILSARRAYGGGWGNASLRPLFIYHLLGDISPGFSSFEVEFSDTLGTFNGGYYFNNHVVDFDGDGKKEIWGFTWDMLTFAVYEAQGKDTYTLQTDVNQATAPDDYGEQNSVGFFDANKDGKLEMFLAGQVSPPSAVFYLPNTDNLAGITTSSIKWLTSPLPVNFQGADIGDIDGDGEVDFFIGDWGPDRKVYRLKHLTGKPYDDSTGYKLDTLFHAPNDSNYTLLNVTVCNDLDGDGKREVIIVNTDVRPDHPEDVSLFIIESNVAVQSVRTLPEIVPTQFSLEQNYPNPFNPSSTIRFSLTAATTVELFITNSIGQRIATLLNKPMDKGVHEVTFNADGLASGTYFYTLKAGNYVQTKKMMLMK